MRRLTLAAAIAILAIVPAGLTMTDFRSALRYAVDGVYSFLHPSQRESVDVVVGRPGGFTPAREFVHGAAAVVGNEAKSLAALGISGYTAQPGDALVFGMWSSHSGVLLQADVQLVEAGTLERRVMPVQLQPLAGVAVVGERRFVIALPSRAYITTVSVRVVTNNEVQHGEVYVRVSLASGPAQPGYNMTELGVPIPNSGLLPANYSLLAVIGQGYVSSARAITFPETQELPRSGPGAIKRYAMQVFGAGLDGAVEVQANCTWRIRGVTGVLATSANAGTGNREPLLLVSINGDRIFASQSSLAQPISSGYRHTWFAGGVMSPQLTVPQEVVAVAGLPENWMLGKNMIVSVLTGNLEAADQWSQMFVDVEEWVDPLAIVFP